MDYGRVIVDAWKVARRTAALWRLGVFSAVQVLLYTVIIGGLIVPMSVLTQLLVAARRGSLGGATSDQAVDPALSQWLTVVVAWLSGHWLPLVAGGVALTALWAVFGVLDVAATAGIISQTEAVAQRRDTSVAAGLRAGFRVWWRIIGLLAISALPTLLYMLAIAVFMLFTVSLPLYRGELPSVSAIGLGNSLTTPLSSIVTLANIPLGVLVALGLRFAVLEDTEWRESFGRAWQLVRTRFADVALMYLVLFGVLMLVSLVFAVVLAVFAVAVIVAVLGLSASGGTLGALAVAIIALAMVLGVAGGLTFMVVTLVWQSVAWTIFWRRVTGRETEHAVPARSAVQYVSANNWEAGR